jgi:bacterioferritin-associated ferredoxin
VRRILCLCHDVTDADIARAVRLGYRHPETIKRFTGALMGPCQGRTCADLVLDAIARETGVHRESLAAPTSRPPAFPIRMGLLAAGDDGGPRESES